MPIKGHVNFCIPQPCSNKIEELPVVCLVEAAKERFRDFEGQSGIEDSASRAF
jgi:hypothetical protein